MKNRGILSLGAGSGKWIVLSAFMLFLNGAAYIVEILLIGNFIRKGADPAQLPRLLVFLAAVLVFKAVAAWAESEFSCVITIKVKSSIRENIFSKVRRLGPAYVDSSGTAELVSNSLDGVEALEIFFGRFMPQLIYSLIIPIVLFITTFRIYPAFSGILLAAVPVIPLSMMFISKWAARSMKGFWNDYQGLSALFLENLQGITTLKLFNRSEKRMTEMESKAWDFRNSTMALLKMQLTSITVMDTLVYGFAAVGIVLAVRGLFTGIINYSEFFILLMLSVEFFLPIRKLGSLFHAGVNGIQAGGKIAEFLDSPEPEIVSETASSPSGSDVVFENVSFSYSPDLPVILDNASYSFPAGGRYGIAGASGSGKSTMGRLLLRFFDPTAGSILLGGVPTTKVAPEKLHKLITLVEAHSYIFDGTIADNLRLASDDADEEKMLEACRAAGLIENASELQKETGEAGAKLSGGERQRLAIARAILLDPDIYIFDEAAGSVDAESEDIIKNTIYSLPPEKTVFIISHRMTMFDRIDRLLTVRGGKIVEYADAGGSN